ncbi:MAG: PilZ domain-containing protein [Deltaproteobacteria bacterium]|nr:PilZ domain-containing protein [Deltaproteobacteria bacterium]
MNPPIHMHDTTAQRAHPRAEIGERCWIETSKITLFARMENISLGGVFIRTATPIPDGTVLSIRWTLEEGGVDLEAKATVVWSRAIGHQGGLPAGMGLSFHPLAPALWKSIDAYVTRRLAS